MIQNLKASKALASNVKTLREFKNMSLAELGEAIGVSRQAIWNIENEQSWVTKETIAKLADAFGVEETDLFSASLYKIESKLVKKKT